MSHRLAFVAETEQLLLLFCSQFIKFSYFPTGSGIGFAQNIPTRVDLAAARPTATLHALAKAIINLQNGLHETKNEKRNNWRLF